MPTSTPLYDLFDGLSRRRRLRRIGYDPDALVTEGERDLQLAPKDAKSTSEQSEAAA
jgi:hypothetical protein